jgi:hypothetical protein
MPGRSFPLLAAKGEPLLAPAPLIGVHAAAFLARGRGFPRCPRRWRTAALTARRSCGDYFAPFGDAAQPTGAGASLRDTCRLGARGVVELALANSRGSERTRTMAYGVVHRFAGGTREQYEASLAKVHPNAGADLPEGQTLHIAGPTEDGWIVVAIHDSRESWERFRDETLTPGFQEIGETGFAGPPEETTFEVDKLQQA